MAEVPGGEAFGAFAHLADRSRDVPRHAPAEQGGDESDDRRAREDAAIEVREGGVDGGERRRRAHHGDDLTAGLDRHRHVHHLDAQRLAASHRAPDAAADGGPVLRTVRVVDHVLGQTVRIGDDLPRRPAPGARPDEGDAGIGRGAHPLDQRLDAAKLTARDERRHLFAHQARTHPKVVGDPVGVEVAGEAHREPADGDRGQDDDDEVARVDAPEEVTHGLKRPAGSTQTSPSVARAAASDQTSRRR